jgi:hypothetical protein
MTELNEALLMINDSYTSEVANEIFDGILSYFNITKKEETQMETKPTQPITTPTQEVSEWAKTAQKFVIDNKISSGSDPKKYMTREECWVMMERMYKLLKK